MRKPHPRTFAIVAGAIVLLALSYGLWARKQGPKVTYEPVQAQRGPIEVSILTTGVVSPENRVEIKPPVAGRVEKVLINEGDRVKKDQTLAWMSSTERAALLDAATAKGPEELKEWEDMYRPTPILAPINGMIIQRNVESGQTFSTSDAVFVMSDRLTVKAQVDETDISQIKLKQKAMITLDAYPDETFSAFVDQIAYDAKTVNNVTTYVVDVLPHAAPAFMRSGMTANVSFSVDSKPDALLVPAEAVKENDDNTTVLVPGPNGKPVPKEVETGLTDGKKIEIVSGLSENDTVFIPHVHAPGKRTPGRNAFSPMGHPHGR